MQHGPSSDPFTFFLCSSAFNPYISTSVKLSNLASKEGSSFLLVLLFFFFFSSPAWTSRGPTFHFGNQRVGGKKMKMWGKLLTCSLSPTDRFSYRIDRWKGKKWGMQEHVSHSFRGVIPLQGALPISTL